jgi:ketosteroid isomerase-like protein
MSDETAFDPITDELVALARDAYRMFVEGDPAFLDTWDPEIEFHVPETLPGGGALHGHLEVLAFFETVSGLWEDARPEPEEFLAAGDKLVVLGRWRARARSTGLDVELPFAHVQQFRSVNGFPFPCKPLLVQEVGWPPPRRPNKVSRKEPTEGAGMRGVSSRVLFATAAVASFLLLAGTAHAATYTFSGPLHTSLPNGQGLSVNIHNLSGSTVTVSSMFVDGTGTSRQTHAVQVPAGQTVFDGFNNTGSALSLSVEVVSPTGALALTSTGEDGALGNAVVRDAPGDFVVVGPNGAPVEAASAAADAATATATKVDGLSGKLDALAGAVAAIETTVADVQKTVKKILKKV